MEIAVIVLVVLISCCHFHEEEINTHGRIGFYYIKKEALSFKKELKNPKIHNYYCGFTKALFHYYKPLVYSRKYRIESMRELATRWSGWWRSLSYHEPEKLIEICENTCQWQSSTYRAFEILHTILDEIFDQCHYFDPLGRYDFSYMDAVFVYTTCWNVLGLKKEDIETKFNSNI